jgi:hypothetical protein
VSRYGGGAKKHRGREVPHLDDVMRGELDGYSRDSGVRQALDLALQQSMLKLYGGEEAFNSSLIKDIGDFEPTRCKLIETQRFSPPIIYSMRCTLRLGSHSPPAFPMPATLEKVGPTLQVQGPVPDLGRQPGLILDWK